MVHLAYFMSYRMREICLPLQLSGTEQQATRYVVDINTMLVVELGIS